MTLQEEVRAFARDFIGGNRTAARLATIRAAYREITGTTLHSNCETCVIEAVFKIIKHMEKQPTTKLYELKKGAVLQPFGGGIITNENLTDEIAEDCLRNIKGAASLFARMPEVPAEPEFKAVQPKAADLAAAAAALNTGAGPDKVPAPTLQKAPAKRTAKPKAKKVK
jgi:hypothetical protein